MKIKQMRISELKPYPKNPRINDGAVNAVAASIREFGWKQPLVVDKDGVIVAGHTRYKAAQKLGIEEVPVVVADDLTPEQVKAYRLADNKTAELAEWDFSKLEEELAELDFDMSEFGFDDIDTPDPVEVREDDYDIDAPVEPKAQLGGLWQLGRHRLLCGDSTDTDAVDRLMGGQKAKMLFTSPPYSDMREYNGNKDLSVDTLVRFISTYRPYTNYQCVNLGIQRKEHEIVQYWDSYIAEAKSAGYKLLAWNVWDKMECGSIGQQSAFFPIRHEWIFVFGTEFFEINRTWEKADASINRKEKKRAVRQPDGSMRYSTIGDTSNKLKQMESVLSLYPELNNEVCSVHPATFPVGLPAEYIKAMTQEGDNVIEPFGGSGTTLIACEQLNRRCYMMELDPHYCDVIIDRWEKLTGEQAVLLNG